ncbi:orotidine 5'-phosphate decarboxylase [Desulfurococcus mucosus DSM 2162]|uniref:Orotidine 5'-phosphate decarboxylase n=1 Tax=Desulfurococcus mucosus (strain ATCC 35584 / DSM 2162 / JCM 9187 / O7/1) TaxID=765177 RepID=E8R8P8_DESM0|nr:orotidine 5'-phosphate decarboxylase [Desulfurococcus mucosus DSM 2162]
MLVVALDPPVREKGRRKTSLLVEELDKYVSGYKIGLPFLIKHGRRGIRELRKSTEKPIIVDLKLADIGDVMAEVLRHLARLGVDAVIAHAFTGYTGALEDLSKASMATGVGLIIVVSMSHRGSEEYIDRHVDEFLELAARIRAKGVVAPATRPRVIRHVREVLGDTVEIYSPGIGIQGAEPGSALCAGANYEIVGRLITRSGNPGETARAIREMQLERWLKCRG